MTCAGDSARDDRSPIVRAREAIAAASQIVFFTGAGVSAESGIPTFRDALTGLWARFDPEALATEQGFRADPALVWRWYAERRRAVLRASPNAAHRAIAGFAASRPQGSVVVTQNVDGLHRRAGSRDVLELHGDITRVKCIEGCGAPEAIDAACDWEHDPRVPPPCPRCGAHLRPDVVWFGELLPERVFEHARREAAHCDLMLVVGTSVLVHPAAELPQLARRAGAAIVVVDPQPTAIDDLATLCVRATASAALPELLAR